MNALVSVIIPTFNRATLLNQALRSVREQTYAPLEIIVVDDGSTDDTRAVVQQYGDAVRYLHQYNRGPATARNLGITSAQGDILAFLDDDDVWLPRAVELGVAGLLDPALQPVEMVFGRTQRAENIVWTAAGLTYELVPPTWTVMSFCSVFCRKRVFDRIGMIDPTLRCGEDLDWFMRVREAGVPFAFLSEITHLYRRHARNMTLDQERVNQAQLLALKLSLTRRANNNFKTIHLMPEIPQVPLTHPGEAEQRQ